MNLIDSYRYLAALQQHRHFGRAAAACHITQPALSNALRALEEHLDVAIVRRGRQYEGLTAEGERVLASAHLVLREQEALRQELAGSEEQPRGRLVIGAVPTAVPIAARFAARLVERHPGVQPQVQSLSSQEIETGLDTLAIDLGLGYTDRVSAATQTWPQYIEHYYLLRRAAKAGAAFRFGAALRWAEAATLPLCMLSPEMHNRAILDRVFRELGLSVKPVIETNSVMALLVGLQAADPGSPLAAVLPGAVVATMAHHQGLEALPLTAPDLRTPIGFMSASVSRARRSRALEAALRQAADAGWLAHASAHSGPLRPV